MYLSISPWLIFIYTVLDNSEDNLHNPLQSYNVYGTMEIEWKYHERKLKINSGVPKIIYKSLANLHFWHIAIVM